MAFAMPRARIRVWSRLTSAWLLASEVVQAVHRGILEKNLGWIDSFSLVRQRWTSGEGRGVMAHAPVPPRIRRVQVSALVLLVIAGTLNYVDRAALSIANPLIREELGLSIADMGLLLSAFLWAYAFSQLPGGALTDRLGPRHLLDPGLFVWSLAQAAAGLVGW
jgi:hypothetical protein